MLQRVGVVVVHGIGEQKRYEHLDGQARDFINAIIEAHDGGPNFVTVELRDGLSTAFRGTENTWLADNNCAAVRAVIRDGNGHETQLFTHESLVGRRQRTLFAEEAVPFLGLGARALGRAPQG